MRRARPAYTRISSCRNAAPKTIRTSQPDARVSRDESFTLCCSTFGSGRNSETVPVDNAWPNIFPVKNVLESDFYRGSFSPGRAGHSNDGVVFRHVSVRSGSGVRLRQPAGDTVHYTRTKPLEKQNISYCVISNILSYQTYGTPDGRNPRCILRSDNSKYSNRLPGT